MRIDETLLNEAKAFAARNGRSLNSVMEDALKQLLGRAATVSERPRVELVTAGDALDQGLVDLSPGAIKEMLLQEDTEHYLEVMRDEAARREHSRQRPSTGR
ncbi:hypothetical protein N5079_13710 [Planotetraspora sp. A-T 1434]|uniref:hypothetical protein n=1 Tax=Planotetraspora sp. A-T 1434 TaxID=2979219 RepID=UPI0021C01F89|nr:hypothetical protein [Planotetraspora sp. A-T 1434]MCT9931274.1 hypothetical protein [Planotetraspora sp. A-T 1434]